MITVVMTAYNVGEYIGRAMRSVLDSTYRDIELLIVEDCSTDNTLAIAKGIAKEDNRVNIIRHERNKGCGWARRTGIENAKGEYIITIDADDYIGEDFLQSLYNKAIETGADVICGGVTQIYNSGAYEKYSYGEVVKEGCDKVLHLMSEKVPFMNNKLIHRSLHSLVPYCTRRFIEDMPTITKIMYYAKKVAYVNNDTYFYVQRDTSLIHSADGVKNFLYRALYLQDIADFFEKESPDMIKKLNMLNTFQYYLSALKQINPTAEQIEPYKDDWVDFTRRLIVKNI